MRTQMKCLVFSFLLLTSIISEASVSLAKPRWSLPGRNWAKLAGKITKQAVKEICTSYPLYVALEGGGMMGGVNEISVGFGIHQPLTKEEARRIAVFAIETILTKINKNEQVRPYLCCYPFTVSQVSVSVISEHHDYQPYSYPNILSVSNIRDKLYYHTIEEGEKFDYKTEEFELYSEALEIVRQENNDSKQ